MKNPDKEQILPAKDENIVVVVVFISIKFKQAMLIKYACSYTSS